MSDKVTKRYLWLLVVLTLALKSTAIYAEKLVGEAFTDPSLIWRSVTPDWVLQPITPDAALQHADLVVTLDQQLYSSLFPLIQTYAKTHGLTISVTKGTCGISRGQLFRKAVDIGGYCCPPGLTDRLPGLRFHTLAIAAIALFVHPDNPIENITLSKARALFGGEITDWTRLVYSPEVKAPRSVHPIGRLHCERRPGHWRLLLNNAEQFSPDLLEVGTIEDMVRMVTIDPQAIGYETLFMIRSFQRLVKLKPLRINGMSPNDKKALATGRYPLYHVYNVTTWEGAAANPLARKLVHYLQTRVQELDKGYAMMSASELRANGWKFEADELIGKPAPRFSQESGDGYPVAYDPIKH